MGAGCRVADWERTEEPEAPPTPAVVYLELGVGCVAAFVAAATYSLVAGIGAIAFTTSLQTTWTGVAVGVAGISVLSIGLTQWTWLVPAMAVLFRRRRPLALGLAIGGVIVAMLNGTCVTAIFAG